MSSGQSPAASPSRVPGLSQLSPLPALSSSPSFMEEGFGDVGPSPYSPVPARPPGLAPMAWTCSCTQNNTDHRLPCKSCGRQHALLQQLQSMQSELAVKNMQLEEQKAAKVAADNAGPAAGSWICKCTFHNRDMTKECQVCGELPESLKRLQDVQGQLSVMAIEQERKDKIAALRARQLEVANKNASDDWPSYWSPFASGSTYLEVQLCGNPMLQEEFDKVLSTFTSGGIKIQAQQVQSLLRIQNKAVWKAYAAQRTLLAAKRCNNGNAAERYLFHGPRKNTDSIKAQGFVSQYANSNPYGIWFSTQSSYSGRSFADVLPGGARRIFVSKVCVGTLGKDDGTGRRPNKVSTGELADTHHAGHIYVTYSDRQCYPEYLIQWR